MAGVERNKAASGRSESTPLIKQYERIKALHPDHILFFRCGDFYEMFFDDARQASAILGITLTTRGVSAEGDPVPLAGIPYHSVEPYLAKMIRAGQRVAICEQMENPKLAKGVVKREVVRVVTPGTVLEDNLLENKANNYLAAIIEEKGHFGFAALDFSTGQFAVTEFRGKDTSAACANELSRIAPSELIVLREQRDLLSELGLIGRDAIIAPLDGGISTFAAREALFRQFGVRDLRGFGAEETPLAVRAAGAILQYLRETQKSQLIHLNDLRVYYPGNYMLLDATTQRSLELVANLTDATRRHTLLEVLDNTCTAMGGRMLRQWVLQPLRDPTQIEARLDALECFVRDHLLRSKTAEHLKAINDLERIVSRAGCKTANARDLLALKNSLGQIPKLRHLFADGVPANGDKRNSLLLQLRERLDPLETLTQSLQRGIADNPPLSVREGGLIRTGFDAALDELRSIAADSKSWIATMRQQEIERTGIPNLKIGFNGVFGYYIEISNSHLGKIPPEYIRKQTLANAERFFTTALKEKEEIILHAEERGHELEFEIFERLREEVCACARSIQQTAQAVAVVDTILSLSQAAVAHKYCRPRIYAEGLSEEGNRGDEIVIKDGRHPVLEALDLDQPFVPNDTELNCSDYQILLITGPNMAGKSTYIRQVALITLMAHMGSFVPAAEARIGLADRIFTRVGAMDQLARGQSTFLVEMSETANILNNATDRSLVILDEIGRGTSTYDGLSIAWAVIEYLHNTLGRRPRTLFATHYHELTELEGPLPRLKNYNVAVLEEEDRVAFLYKIVRGSTDHSYGIYAAQVAGVPKPAIARAKEILANLEEGNSVEVASKGSGLKIKEKTVQLTLFDAVDNPVLEKLRSIDPHAMTPMEALALLADLCAQARN